MESIIAKKILIWLMLTINLLFVFMIGLTIPIMETETRDLFGWVMIPMLVVLNYIILDRFHYYTKQEHNREEKSNDTPK